MGHHMWASRLSRDGVSRLLASAKRGDIPRRRLVAAPVPVAHDVGELDPAALLSSIGSTHVPPPGLTMHASVCALDGLVAASVLLSCC